MMRWGGGEGAGLGEWVWAFSRLSARWGCDEGELGESGCEEERRQVARKRGLKTCDTCQ